MRQLQLIAHGEPSDVIKLNTVTEPALGQEDVLISLEAAPLNPSDFMLVRGRYGVRPTLPFSLGSEGVGRVAKVGSKVDVALQGKRADPALRGSRRERFLRPGVGAARVHLIGSLKEDRHALHAP